VIDKENEAIQQARSKGTRYKPLILSNGDTPKQLLARSRYLLYKFPSQWTQSQLHRVALLFQLYPSIEKAYRLAWDFRSIYELVPFVKQLLSLLKLMIVFKQPKE